jgi:hypothetical protein
MQPLHIQLTAEQPSARFSATRVPRLEFRSAAFISQRPGWQRLLYPAAVLVTTMAHDPQGRTLATDHQALRFALLYDHTWPEPVFQRTRNWNYRPLEIRKGIPVAGWIVAVRLRDLRLQDDERVDLIVLG